MRILLQHVTTQQYLRDAGSWTANPFEALDFQQSQAALEFARDHGISGVQIAVKFIDSQFDEIVPLPPFQPTVQRPAV
jgi:aryl-alcohol dehydrogenase-like predicted oxidoreductase